MKNWINWCTFTDNSIKEIEKIIPKDKESEKRSVPFLIMVRFAGFKNEFEPKIANLYTYKEKTIISIHGITGTMEISHYALINKPTTNKEL